MIQKNVVEIPENIQVAGFGVNIRNQPKYLTY